MVTASRRRVRRYVETDEYMRMMARLVRAAGRRVGEADADDLGDLFGLQAELEMTIVRAIANLRTTGMTWQEIGDVAGTTRQAALMRWQPKIDALAERKGTR